MVLEVAQTAVVAAAQVAPLYMEIVHLEKVVLIETMAVLERMLVQAEAAVAHISVEVANAEVLEVWVLFEYFINEEVLYGL